MIYIATKDKLDEHLVPLLDYVCRSFGLGADQLIDSPPAGLPVILVQPQDGTYVQGDTNLVDFTHPDDCVYLFGGTHGNLELDFEPDAKLYIPHQPTWNLYAPQAVAIVLYDRYVKRGDFG